MDEVINDGDLGPLVSLDDAAWLALTSRQNVRNWLKGSFKDLPDAGKHYVALVDLAAELDRRGRPTHLDVSWLDLSADDPPLSVCRDAVQRLAEQPDRATRSGSKAAEAAHQQALEEAWAGERAAARERDEARAEADGYATALRALVTKDDRIRELRSTGGP